MIKYWRGKHVILRKEDVIADYMERVRSRPRDKVTKSLLMHVSLPLSHSYLCFWIFDHVALTKLSYRKSLRPTWNGNLTSQRRRRNGKLSRSRRSRKKGRRRDKDYSQCLLLSWFLFLSKSRKNKKGRRQDKPWCCLLLSMPSSFWLYRRRLCFNKNLPEADI